MAFTTVSCLFEVIIVLFLFHSGSVQRSFVVDYENNQFLKDGKPYRYIAGSMHYFRIPYQYWTDRLMKLKFAGLNAVQTYVALNVHQPSEEEFDFTGNANLFHFIEIAQNLSLDVILRMGPYICAEWEFGGFPWWLLKIPDIRLRTSDGRFLIHVQKWFEKILPMLTRYLYKNGGPIISMQIENEYGSRPMCDNVYLTFLRDLFRRYVGVDFVLFTTDGATIDYLSCGHVAGVYPTVDFGPMSDATEIDKAFIAQRIYAPNGPLVNSEFYSGWLDLWGNNHSVTETAHVIDTMTYMYNTGASFSFYMFHGGSNFGYMNGASWTNQPSTQSYDYDAPLNEAGDPTEKYFAIRNRLCVLNRNCDQILNSGPPPKSSEKSAFGEVEMKLLGKVTDLLDILCPRNKRVLSHYPKSFEDINFGYGFVLYETKLRHCGRFLLRVENLSDRGYVMVDGVVQGILSQWLNREVEILAKVNGKLQILVENMGRQNMGPRDPKGILSLVSLGDELLEDWTIYPLTIDNVFDHIEDIEKNSDVNLTHTNFSPSIYYSTFRMPNLADTFLDPTNWTKGQLFINRFNVGRYWSSLGPQVTLYVPKPILKTETTVAIFELENPGNCNNYSNSRCKVHFVSQPILNKTTSGYLDTNSPN